MEVIVFMAFDLSVSASVATLPGMVVLTTVCNVVTFSKGIHNFLVPYKVPAPVPRVQGQTIGPFILHQANRLQDRGDPNASQSMTV